jgi:serine-type D-Ala-D-Ala carboxypeptidase/endopeptidase (penicillin-binding protein 4)
VNGVPRHRGPLLAVLTLLLAAAPAGAQSLETTVARQLARAGGASGAYVLDTTTGRPLASVRAAIGRNPASVEKLYTTATALLRLGPAATLDTTVLGAGTLDDAGTWQGDLYLHGGGDPTFGAAGFAPGAYGVAGPTVDQLVAQLQAAGIVSVTGGVLGDESLLDRLRGPPATGDALDVTDLGGPLGGLLFDRGLPAKARQPLPARPALVAAQQLAAALRRAHVHVGGHSGEGAAPVGAQPLASVSSPPLATLVRLTLVPSDNFIAELLLKLLGARFAGAGSSAGGAAVVRATIARLGIHPTIADGSGLSRADRTSPRQVVALLAALRGNASLRAALPVAGRTGTLAKRMRHTTAQDACDAKTGTLSNVSALAGYCTAANGHLLAFALIENGVSTFRAKAAEDRLVVALARSRPAGAPPVVTQPPVTTPTTPAPPSSGGGASPSGR